jgi:hypothetical protein
MVVDKVIAVQDKQWEIFKNIYGLPTYSTVVAVQFALDDENLPIRIETLGADIHRAKLSRSFMFSNIEIHDTDVTCKISRSVNLDDWTGKGNLRYIEIPELYPGKQYTIKHFDDKDETFYRLVLQEKREGQPQVGEFI